MSQRGTTGAGRHALLPGHAYAPTTPKSARGFIDFEGEDGRRQKFDVASLPLPGWHASILAGLEVRMGPSGTLRTRASATNAWGSVFRFMHFLGGTLRPPASPQDLKVEHIDAFYRFRTDDRQVSERSARLELRDLALTLETPPVRSLVSDVVLERLRPRAGNATTGVSGYSDGELGRLVRAARDEVTSLVRRLSTLPTTPKQANEKANNSIPSRVMLYKSRGHQSASLTRSEADNLFVMRSDLTAMLVLAVATTGWNVEAIKELPLAHRVLEGLAVELEVTKRRRGSGRWHKTVTWEIGAPHRQLETPGGIYLLFSQLMSRAREHLSEPAFWAVWNYPGRVPAGCRNPFAKKISGDLNHSTWTTRHQIMADSTDGLQSTEVLRLDFNRLKTSIDVRRTRQMGGHLPSAARSNTTGVLFRNYLAGDKSTIEWSRELLADTVADLERDAWESHRQALDSHGRTSLTVRQGESGQVRSSGEEPTAWTACSDHDHHPITGRKCRASFLDCFHCGNCVITGDHLGQLLGLLDALEARRHVMSQETWWKRYGPTWAAIRLEVLPNFSESELRTAAAMKPLDSALDLVEPRWEQP